MKNKSLRNPLKTVVLRCAVVFFFCLFMLSPLFKVKADEGYTYTIRIYSGQQGTFTGETVSSILNLGGTIEEDGTVAVFRNKKAGDTIPFDRGSIELIDSSKYYIAEIRESGKDNYDPEHPQLSTITVSKDQDYVVAYGIAGSSVDYTINYVDINGNPMEGFPSQTFYGNIGDVPAVAYQYIPGYFPHTQNLQKKLSANAAENVFTFIYQKAEPTEVIEYVTVEVEEENNLDFTGTGIQNIGQLPQNPDEVPGTIVIDGGDTPRSGGEDQTETQTETETETDTKEIPDQPSPTSNSKQTLYWIIGGVAAAAAVAVAVVLITTLKKKRNR